MSEGPNRIVMLCTGNAARSVMATVMLRARRPDLEVIGAGTHALEGLPMSARTRNALAVHGLAQPDHRSRQLAEADVVGAHLVVGFAPEHVSYVRRRHPVAATRCATLHHLVAALPAGDQPLCTRLHAIDLGRVDLDDGAAVADPAGGDEATFVSCANEIDALLDRLARLL